MLTLEYQHQGRLVLVFSTPLLLTSLLGGLHNTKFNRNLNKIINGNYGLTFSHIYISVLFKENPGTQKQNN